MGFCETCPIPFELSKLDVAGNYSAHLSNPEVVDAIKSLYGALGKLGVCANGMPRVEEIHDNSVSIWCDHELTDMSKDNFVLSQLGDALEEFDTDSSFVPTITVGSFADLPIIQQELVAEIIRTESIPEVNHGIAQSLLDAYPDRTDPGV